MNVLQEAQLWRYAATLTANTLSGSDRAITLERWASHIHQVSIPPRCTLLLLNTSVSFSPLLYWTLTVCHHMACLQRMSCSARFNGPLGIIHSSLVDAATTMVSGQNESQLLTQFISRDLLSLTYTLNHSMLKHVSCFQGRLCNANSCCRGVSESYSRRYCAFASSYLVFPSAFASLYLVVQYTTKYRECICEAASEQALRCRLRVAYGGGWGCWWQVGVSDQQCCC